VWKICTAFPAIYSHYIKRNAVPLQAWTGPYGSNILRPPEFFYNRNMQVVRFSAVLTGRLYPPRRYPWHAYLLEAESASGSYYGRKDLVIKITVTPSGIEPATFQLVLMLSISLASKIWGYVLSVLYGDISLLFPLLLPCIPPRYWLSHTWISLISPIIKCMLRNHLEALNEGID
jgi:hypothetical protein